MRASAIRKLPLVPCSHPCLDPARTRCAQSVFAPVKIVVAALDGRCVAYIAEVARAGLVHCRIRLERPIDKSPLLVCAFGVRYVVVQSAGVEVEGLTDSGHDRRPRCFCEESFPLGCQKAGFAVLLVHDVDGARSTVRSYPRWQRGHCDLLEKPQMVCGTRLACACSRGTFALAARLPAVSCNGPVPGPSLSSPSTVSFG